MKYSPGLARLIEALRVLPGVGPKSAQRMTFHLLERNRDGARALARALEEAASNVVHCRRCRMLTDGELCEICAAPRRDASSLCIVESPADVVAVEQSGGYGGRYFVLMGHLSPLDGIGPEQLGFDRLEALLDEGEVREVILATNPNTEGEAPANYIGKLLRPLGVRVTRLTEADTAGGVLQAAPDGRRRADCPTERGTHRDAAGLEAPEPPEPPVAPAIGNTIDPLPVGRTEPH